MTSAVIKSALVGRGRSFFNKTEEMLLSLMCNGRLLARGWIKRVIQDNKLLVGPSHSETTGLRGQFGLCFLVNHRKEVCRYSWEAVQIPW